MVYEKAIGKSNISEIIKNKIKQISILWVDRAVSRSHKLLNKNLSVSSDLLPYALLVRETSEVPTRQLSLL